MMYERRGCIVEFLELTLGFYFDCLYMTPKEKNTYGSHMGQHFQNSNTNRNLLYQAKSGL